MERGRRVWQEVCRRLEVRFRHCCAILSVQIDNRFDDIFRFYTSEYNPLIGIDLLKLGKILPHLNEFQAAISRIRDAGDVLKITHGEQSKICREFVKPLLIDAQQMLEESQRVNRPPSDDEEEEEEA